VTVCVTVSTAHHVLLIADLRLIVSPLDGVPAVIVIGVYLGRVDRSQQHEYDPLL